MRPLAPTPPATGDREALIAGANPRGRAIYGLVRRLVDELDEAAPWSLLYAPPADRDELRTHLGRLLGRVEDAPSRIAKELVGSPTANAEPRERAALEEAAFYFTALHHMTASNRRLLRSALDRMPEEAVLSRATADYLGEVAADLKGRYSSAMMGAATALISDGRWVGADMEAVLFPEKAEEQLRNRGLLAALEAAKRAAEAVGTDFPWLEVLTSWRAWRPVDRYALSDLIDFRHGLFPLLSLSNRRALYAGDYHHLQRREVLLGSRLRAIEELHLMSLDVAIETSEEEKSDLYSRLCQLLLEVAAIVDVTVLRSLVGAERVRELRETEVEEGVEVDPLVFLVGEEDLTFFLTLLLGAVGKRTSLVADAARDTAPGPGEARREAARVVEEAPRPARLGPVRADTRAMQQAGEKLASALSRLTSRTNDSWRAFQMVHNLHIRLRFLPAALTAEARPFLAELRTELVPLLDEAHAVGALSDDVAETLRGCIGRLTAAGGPGSGGGAEPANDLVRVMRLLESLDRAAVTWRTTPD